MEVRSIPPRAVSAVSAVSAARRGTLLLTLTIAGACSGGESPTAVAENAVITVVSGDNQSALRGLPLAQPFVVRVTNQGGKPLQGLRVHWFDPAPSSFPEGHPKPSATETVTGADGTTQISMQLPDAYGGMSFWATVVVDGLSPGLYGPSAFFNATAINPCDAPDDLPVGSTVSGVVGRLDCQVFDTTLGHAYRTVASTETSFTVTATGTGMLPFIHFYSGAVTYIVKPLAGSNSAALHFIQGAGLRRKMVVGQQGVRSYGGAYTVRVEAVPEDVTNCDMVFLGTATLQQVSATDCDLGDGLRGDKFPVVIFKNATLKVLMESTAVDAYLRLERTDGFVVQEADGGGGGANAQFSYTASESNVFYIVATTASPGQFGSYRLSFPP